MDNYSERSIHEVDPNRTPTALVEQHLNEWLLLLDHLRDTHASTDELHYCRNQVTRLQLDLFKLRNA